MVNQLREAASEPWCDVFIFPVPLRVRNARARDSSEPYTWEASMNAVVCVLGFDMSVPDLGSATERLKPIVA